MAVRLELDMRVLAQIEEAISKAGNIAIHALHDDVVAAQVMPFDSSFLQNDQTTTEVVQMEEATSYQLVTDTIYARRLYYHPEYNFQTVNNPNAQGEWLEPWINGAQKEFLLDSYAKALKGAL